MATEKTFTVTQEGHPHIFTDQTAAQVARRLEMAKGGDPLTVTVERPIRDFNVFYIGGSSYGDPRYNQWQGFGNQVRTLPARTHHEACCDGARWSQHSQKDTRYLVVGPEYGFDTDREEIVARLFEINKVDSAEDADFTADTGRIIGHYTVTEVPA